MFSVTLLKTKIHLFNLNKSSVSHLLKSRYMILLICTSNWLFMEEQKSTTGKGRNNYFISIIVFS